MKWVPLIIAFAVLAPACERIACAQDATPPPHKSLFDVLGVQPGGNNGYEELLAAGEISQVSGSIDPSITLAEKRRLLEDPAIQRVLSLLRAGLAKPVSSVFTHFDENTLLPQFAAFRNIARTLMVEQYVLLADGKTAAAIEDMRDGLRLGRAIQLETLISGLVGIAIDAISVKLIAVQMEQMSARDCDRILSIVNDWLSAPSVAPLILANERDMSLDILERGRQNPRGLLSMISSDDDPAKNAELSTALAGGQAAAGQLIDQAVSLVKSKYDAIIRAASGPPYESPPEEILDDKSPANLILSSLLPTLGAVTDRYGRDASQIRLLGLQAAIRKFRWDHDKLPDTLAELKAGKLAIDPFTGKPMMYERHGERYDVYSAGPVERDDSGRPIPGQRVPIYLPYRPR